jgi:hypothetical protein
VTQSHRPARLATRAASFRYGERHHSGIPGGIIPFYPGDFVGIRIVDASMRMGASDLRTKHLITSPVVAFNGCKAVVETNVVIIGENLKLGLGCAGHSRFYDLVEKRGGVWKIVKRQCIYDMGSFTFPIGIVDIDKAIVARYPSAYAPLAYLLEKSGFPVRRVFATKGSDLEVQMKKGGQAWLAQ